MTTIIAQASPPKKKEDEDLQNQDPNNNLGRPISPGKHIRGMNSMFAVESGYEALK